MGLFSRSKDEAPEETEVEASLEGATELAKASTLDELFVAIAGVNGIDPSKCALVINYHGFVQIMSHSEVLTNLDTTDFQHDCKIGDCLSISLWTDVNQKIQFRLMKLQED